MNVVQLSEVRKTLWKRLTPAQPTLTFALPSFTAALDERLALTGPHGCGKTMLLQLLAGLLVPDHGEVLIMGERLDQLSPNQRDHFRGSHIGLLSRESNLWPDLSPLEHLQLALTFGRAIPFNQRRARALEMLDRVGLGHRRHTRCGLLVRGERQRLAVARALVNQPPLVLADEPTRGLHPAAASQVFELLLSLCEDGPHTLLVATNQPIEIARLGQSRDCWGLISESDGDG